MGPLSSVRRAGAALVALLLMSGCPSPRMEAPDDLDGLAHFFWTQQADGSDEELDDAVAKVHELLGEMLAERDAELGVLTHLSDEELAPIGQEGVNDPSEAPGYFVATRFACDLDVLAEILTHPDQHTLRPGVYDSYERVFVGDRDAWLGDDAGLLEWDVTYEATPTATKYTARTHSGIRRVPKLAASVGPALLQRTFLKEPAVFEGEPDNHVFDQDYQAEVFYDAGDGEVFHLYGLWRFMQLGVVSIHDDVFLDFQLDGMVRWDEQTEATCATWPELPEG